MYCVISFKKAYYFEDGEQLRYLDSNDKLRDCSKNYAFEGPDLAQITTYKQYYKYEAEKNTYIVANKRQLTLCDVIMMNVTLVLVLEIQISL